MTGTMGNGHGDGRLDEAALRALIATGDDSDVPADASLPGLASGLNRAASSAPPRPAPGAEEAALAAYRRARDEQRGVRPGPGARVRHRLGRARTAALAGVVAAALGGGVAVAAGGVPFVRDQPSPAAPEPSRPSPHRSPEADDRRTAPERERPAPRETTRSRGPAGSPTADAEAPADVAEPGLTSLCGAHARNPHITPQVLVTAAGGPDRIAAFCADLLFAADGEAPEKNANGSHQPQQNGDGAPGNPPAGNGTPPGQVNPRAAPGTQPRRRRTG